MSVTFAADGRDGKNATDGIDGTSGVDLHLVKKHGSSGTDAGTAMRGEAGARMVVRLVSAKRKDGVLVAKLTADAESPSSGRHMHCKKDKYIIPLTDLKEIDWSARGGTGGAGGIGGDGGDGGKGRQGEDATREKPGMPGRRGGAGGDAGHGSDGRDGGNGGVVELRLKQRDAFLLMAVAGCDPSVGVGDRLTGGKGGQAGKHGKPGKGGQGGDGGKAYSYTVKHIATHSTKTGTFRTVDCELVTMHGGREGPCGRNGKAPIVKLLQGRDGKDGTLKIRLSDAKNRKEVYHGRYDLALLAADEMKVSAMRCHNGEVPTLEFGETVIIPHAKFTNRGKMPTPRQRVMITLDSKSRNITVDDRNRLFLPPNNSIQPFETIVASKGFLRFTTGKPRSEDFGDDFGPIHRTVVTHLRAFQLGPEVKSGSGKGHKNPEFCAEYKSFDSKGTVWHLAPPVENRDGIVGLKSLGSNEKTSLKFSLINTSAKALGCKTPSGRRLLVQFYLMNGGEYDVDLQGVELFQIHDTGTGRPLCIDEEKVCKHGGKGHVVEITNLPAGKEYQIVRMLKFTDKVKPFTRAALQAEILLQDLPRLRPDMKKKPSSNLSLVQRRKFVVSCQPSYKSNPNAKAVIVTSTSTKREQYESWLWTLNELFGLDAETYSLAIYGHLDPSLDVAYEGKEKQNIAKLRDLFAGKLIVVLNDFFTPLPGKSKFSRCRPSSLLYRTQAFHPSTRWLLVGSDPASSRHLSSMSSSLYRGDSVDDETTAGLSAAGDATVSTCDVTETDTTTSSKDMFSSQASPIRPTRGSLGSLAADQTKERDSAMTKLLYPLLNEDRSSSTEDSAKTMPTPKKVGKKPEEPVGRISDILKVSHLDAKRTATTKEVDKQSEKPVSRLIDITKVSQGNAQMTTKTKATKKIEKQPQKPVGRVSDLLKHSQLDAQTTTATATKEVPEKPVSRLSNISEASQGNAKMKSKKIDKQPEKPVRRVCDLLKHSELDAKTPTAAKKVDKQPEKFAGRVSDLLKISQVNAQMTTTPNKVQEQPEKTVGRVGGDLSKMSQGKAQMTITRKKVEKQTESSGRMVRDLAKASQAKENTASDGSVERRLKIVEAASANRRKLKESGVKQQRKGDGSERDAPKTTKDANAVRLESKASEAQLKSQGSVETTPRKMETSPTTSPQLMSSVAKEQAKVDGSVETVASKVEQALANQSNSKDSFESQHRESEKLKANDSEASEEARRQESGQREQDGADPETKVPKREVVPIASSSKENKHKPVGSVTLEASLKNASKDAGSREKMGGRVQSASMPTVSNKSNGGTLPVDITGIDKSSSHSQVRSISGAKASDYSAADSVIHHQSVQTYKDWMKKALHDERRSGRGSELLMPYVRVTVMCNLVYTPNACAAQRILDYNAEKIQKWLMKHDSVHLYVIEKQNAPRPVKVDGGHSLGWSVGNLHIHRGRPGDTNSIVFVNPGSPNTSLRSVLAIHSAAMTYSVVAALNTDVKIRCFADALRGRKLEGRLTNDDAIKVLRDSIVSDFLREVSYMYDSKTTSSDNAQDLCSETLQTLLTSSSMKKLLVDAGSDTKLDLNLRTNLSDLIARLEAAIAPPSGMHPHYWPLSSKHKTRKILIYSVERLKAAWRAYIKEELVHETRKEVDETASGYLGKRSSTGSQWRGALYHIHSPDDERRYSNPCRLEVFRNFDATSRALSSPSAKMSKNDMTPTMKSTVSNSTRKSISTKHAPITIDATEASEIGSLYQEQQKLGLMVRHSLTKQRSSLLQ